MVIDPAIADDTENPKKNRMCLSVLLLCFVEMSRYDEPSRGSL